MNYSSERDFKKLIQEIARLNPDYRFAYKGNDLVLDTKEDIDPEDLIVPGGYIINSRMKTFKVEPKSGSIINSRYNRPIGLLYVDDMKNTKKEDIYNDFIPVEIPTMKQRLSNIKNAIKHNNITNRISYTFSKRAEVEPKENTVKTKENNNGGIGSIKKIKKNKTNVFSNLKNKVQYSLSKNLKLEPKDTETKSKNGGIGTFKKIKKTKTSLNLKNRLSYLFSKRAKVEDDKTNKIVTPTIPTTPTTSTKPINTLITVPTEPTVTPTVTPVEPTVTPVEPAEPTAEDIQHDETVNKYNELKKAEYAKLGKYEKMFIDDALAECLEPTDNEFEQMLNERTVDKNAIYEYYKTLNNLDLDMNKELLTNKYNNFKLGVKNAYARLGEYERMFIDDAFAEGLDIYDPEFEQMLSERTVNDVQIWAFMMIYDVALLEQKKVIDEYSKLTGTESKDYSLYTINELRREAAENKNMLTGAELEKHKVSAFTKAELVEILNRIDSKKQEKEIIKRLTL